MFRYSIAWQFFLRFPIILLMLSSLSSLSAAEPKVDETYWLEESSRIADVSGVYKMDWKKRTHFTLDKHDREMLLEVLAPLIADIETPKAEQIAKVQAVAKKINMNLKEYRGSEGHWLILGATAKMAGCGYYIFRTGKIDREIILQAPHAIYDSGTDKLAKVIFTNYSVRAAFFSDWQRYGNKGATPDKSSRYDMAHNENTLFQEITELCAKRQNAIFIQFHGFAQSSVGGAKAHFILSSGSRKDVPVYIDRLEYELTVLYSKDAVKVFPRNSRLLGGTTNVQGKLLRKLNVPFLHIEISDLMRGVFENSENDVVKFAKVLLKSL